MRNTYVPIMGFADEQNEIHRLQYYAKKGWVLDSIFCGFFYKLRKSEPQEIKYSIDFQLNPDKEYFEIFSESGWDHKASCSNSFHVFSSSNPSAPIYTDLKTHLEGKSHLLNMLNKGLFTSLLCASILFILYVSLVSMPVLTTILAPLLLLSVIFAGLSFLTRMAIIQNIKNIESGNRKTTSKNLYLLLFIVLFSVFVINIVQQNYLSAALYFLLSLSFVPSAFYEK